MDAYGSNCRHLVPRSKWHGLTWQEFGDECVRVDRFLFGEHALEFESLWSKGLTVEQAFNEIRRIASQHDEW